MAGLGPCHDSHEVHKGRRKAIVIARPPPLASHLPPPPLHTWALDGGVGDDEAVDALRRHHCRDVSLVQLRQVGRNLD